MLHSASISWVIPVYNSTETLPLIREEIERTCKENNWTHEILYIVDCINQRTLSFALKAKGDRQNIRVIELSRNFGQHNATLCGIQMAKSEFIVTLDDDLQHPPKEARKLIDTLIKSSDIDVVYGYPSSAKNGLFRNLLSLASRYILQGEMGSIRPREVNSFRAIRTSLCRDLNVGKNSTVNLDVMLSWSTERFGAVEVCYCERTSGKSGYNLKKLVYHALNMLTGYSIKPLRLVSILGIAMSFFGFTMLVIVLFIWLSHDGTVPGFTFLASMITTLSGAQLLSLGIIGEYLARVHLKSLGKPAYLIRRVYD